MALKYISAIVRESQLCQPELYKLVISLGIKLVGSMLSIWTSGWALSAHSFNARCIVRKITL